MSMRDKIAHVIAEHCADCAPEQPHYDTADAIMELVQPRIDKLTTELAAIEFALDGQDPSEHADLKLARLKGSRIRAALKGSDT